MIITEQQFFDYMHCPALFEIKYIKGISIPEQESLSSLLTKVTKFFFLNLLNGKICSTGELKKKWDGICETYSYVIDDKKAISGISLLLKFANWAAQNKIVILDVDGRYNVVVDETEVVGNIGAIAATNNGGQEIVVINFSQKAPDQIILDMSMNYTLEAYGFQKMYNRTLDGIRVFSIKQFKDYYTTRNKEDFRRLETAIKNIGKSIKQQLFYPRENVTCPQCHAKQYCRYWYY